MKKYEVYVSVDIEATGPIPGPFSMISLGAVAFDAGGKEIGNFSENLEQLPFSSMDPDTQKFWDNEPLAWIESTKDARPPSEVIPRFIDWVAALPGTPVFVAYPAGFDWTFVYWYIHMFGGGRKNPFSFAGLDMKTYAMALLKTPFRGTAKRMFPPEWFVENTNKHQAVHDAREQGILFFKILASNGVSASNAELGENKGLHVR